MARVKSFPRTSGTHGDRTYVDSATYGPHTRARRGTHKPAPINAELRKSGYLLVKANAVAKMIHDAIRPYRNGLETGLCWQRLVKMFKEQYKEKGAVDFTKFNKFEVHKRYVLDKLMRIDDVKTQPNEDYSELKIEVAYEPPAFRSKKIISYRLIGIVIYPDVKKKKASTYEDVTPILYLKEEISRYTFTVPIPKRAKEFIFCIKLEGADRYGVVSSGPSMGMNIFLSKSL